MPRQLTNNSTSLHTAPFLLVLTPEELWEAVVVTVSLPRAPSSAELGRRGTNGWSYANEMRVLSSVSRLKRRRRLDAYFHFARGTLILVGGGAI